MTDRLAHKKVYRLNVKSLRIFTILTNKYLKRVLFGGVLICFDLKFLVKKSIKSKIRSQVAKSVGRFLGHLKLYNHKT